MYDLSRYYYGRALRKILEEGEDRHLIGSNGSRRQDAIIRGGQGAQGNIQGDRWWIRDVCDEHCDLRLGFPTTLGFHAEPSGVAHILNYNRTAEKQLRYAPFSTSGRMHFELTIGITFLLGPEGKFHKSYEAKY